MSLVSRCLGRALSHSITSTSAVKQWCACVNSCFSRQKSFALVLRFKLTQMPQWQRCFAMPQPQHSWPDFKPVENWIACWTAFPFKHPIWQSARHYMCFAAVSQNSFALVCITQNLFGRTRVWHQLRDLVWWQIGSMHIASEGTIEHHQNPEQV